MALSHIGASTHNHDHVITPVSLSTMSPSTMAGDSTSWAMFQARPRLDRGRFTLILNTMPP